MKLFTGITTYPISEGSTDPGAKLELIYFLGDVSTTWTNFISVDLKNNTYQRNIEYWKNVKSI